LLKTFAAEDGPALRRAERDGSLLSALRAGCFGFRPLKVTGAISWTRALRALGFAVLAPLGLVFEALVGEKHLFACGEDEFLAAFRTLQDLIVIFHTLLRGSTLVGEPTAPQPCQILLGYAGEERGSQFRLVRECSGKSRVVLLAWGRLVQLPPLLFAETLAR
jgi:hypothetical protein